MQRGEEARFVSLLDEPLRLVDVGCRDGVPAPWLSLGPNVEILGFDPDAAHCAELQAGWPGPGAAEFVPIALGARQESRTLHLTRLMAASSLYLPIAGIWEDYPLLDALRPTGTSTVEVVDLDGYLRERGLASPDVMKLDVQGAELEVFAGAVGALGTVRAIDIEVTFEPMYEGQALFADVHAHLGAAGFKLWQLDSLAHYPRTGDPRTPPRVGANYYDSVGEIARIGGGQLFWGQATYVHRRTLSPQTEREALRDAACFAAVNLPDRMAASLLAHGWPREAPSN